MEDTPMTFEDTSVGNRVIITVHNKDKRLAVESTILNIIDHSLVVDPFIVDETILSFPKSLDIELMVIHPDKSPIYWQKVYIEQRLYHEKLCHVITTKLPGVKYNRRNNFRVFIGEAAKLMMQPDQLTPVTLKDLSNGGFAVLLNKDTELDLHKKITIQYADHENKKYFELSGRPVRKAEFETHNVYGCMLDRRYPNLENYLAQKQMEHRPNRKID